MADKFWMVLAENTNETRVRHASFAAARNEACRLMKIKKGVRFFVLESRGFALEPKPTDWIAHDDRPDQFDDMPF